MSEQDVRGGTGGVPEAGLASGARIASASSELPTPAPELAGLIPGLPVPRELGQVALMSQYRNTQQSIANRAALAIVNLWTRYINPDHFSDTWARLSPLVNGVISTHYEATAASAAQYYTHSRVMAGYKPFGVPGAELDQSYLNTVTNSMGPGMFFHHLKENDADVSSEMARDGMRGASTRMVMMGGRDTITGATGGDPVAEGWERIIEPGACSFCAMLASRGGVYSKGSVDFQAHDHCHCVGRPVFIGQKPVNADLSEAWGRETQGTRGKAALAAWDKYWSSRGNPNADAA